METERRSLRWAIRPAPRNQAEGDRAEQYDGNEAGARPPPPTKSPCLLNERLADGFANRGRHILVPQQRHETVSIIAMTSAGW